MNPIQKCHRKINLKINGVHSSDIPLYSVCSTMYKRYIRCSSQILFKIGSHKGNI